MSGSNRDRERDSFRRRRAARLTRLESKQPSAPSPRAPVYGFTTTPADTTRDVKRVVDAGGEFLLAVPKGAGPRVLLSTANVCTGDACHLDHAEAGKQLLDVVREGWGAGNIETVASEGWERVTGLVLPGGKRGVARPH